MLTEERRALILKKIIENHYVEVAGLADEFEVTQVTIRRDLDILEREGVLIRKHGGAIHNRSGVTLELPYDIKRHEMVKEKEKIAKAAYELINDGDSFILDSGSTTYALALLLHTKVRITVVTNDLMIAVKLAENPKINLICTGGQSRPTVFSLEGSLAENTIKDMRVDKTFLASDAIHLNGVVSNVNMQEVAIKKAMIQATNQTILLADSSKFLNNGFYKVCDLNEVDFLITDKGISKETEKMIRAYPLKCIIV